MWMTHSMAPLFLVKLTDAGSDSNLAMMMMIMMFVLLIQSLSLFMVNVCDDDDSDRDVCVSQSRGQEHFIVKVTRLPWNQDRLIDVNVNDEVINS